MKHTNFHKNFKLNNNSFQTIDEVLSYALHFSPDIHLFLKDWFSEKEVVIVNTSGSTGTPKSIQIEKKQMQYSALATGAFFYLNTNTTALLCLPIAYIAGKMMLIRALTLGWHLDIVESSNNPLKETSKVYDFSAMVPLQVAQSFDKLFQIKKLIIGGGVVPNNLLEKLQNTTTEVFATYGMTETITHIAVKRLNNSLLPQENVTKQFTSKEMVTLQIKTSGKSFYQTLPNTTIYKDERNCLVIKNEKISNEVLFTNDVVDLISDTQFEWLGRFDNVINSGGIKLHPEKIEDKLTKIMKQRFFVAGISDEQLGEKLVLIVEGNTSSLNLTKANLSKFEFPKETFFIDNFIETETKKIQRKKTLDLIFIGGY